MFLCPNPKKCGLKGKYHRKAETCLIAKPKNNKVSKKTLSAPKIKERTDKKMFFPDSEPNMRFTLDQDEIFYANDVGAMLRTTGLETHESVELEGGIYKSKAIVVSKDGKFGIVFENEENHYFLKEEQAIDYASNVINDIQWKSPKEMINHLDGLSEEYKEDGLKSDSEMFAQARDRIARESDLESYYQGMGVEYNPHMDQDRRMINIDTPKTMEAMALKYGTNPFIEESTQKIYERLDYMSLNINGYLNEYDNQDILNMRDVLELRGENELIQQADNLLDIFELERDMPFDERYLVYNLSFEGDDQEEKYEFVNQDEIKNQLAELYGDNPYLDNHDYDSMNKEFNKIMNEDLGEERKQKLNQLLAIASLHDQTSLSKKIRDYI